MKKIVIILLVVGAIAGYWFVTQSKPDNNGDLNTQINTLQGGIGQEFSVLSSRAQEIGGLAQNLFSTSIQKDDSGQSAQQKAINYGQYLYCKQVVESYETENQ